MAAELASELDDLQHYGMRVALAVLLSRHCDSETSEPFAGVGDPQLTRRR